MYVEKSSGVNSGSAHLHLFSGQSTVVIARNWEEEPGLS